MAVIVTKMPGGIAQVYNPETGKITYKCKGESAFMEIEAFGGIVKFTKKGAKAIVSGPIASVENCEIIKPGDKEYDQAKNSSIKAQREFKEQRIAQLTKEIDELK